MQATVDYTRRSPNQKGPDGEPLQAAQYRAAMAFLNISCVQFSLAIPTESPTSSQLYSLSLVALPDYLTALTAAANSSDATTDEPSLGDMLPGTTDADVLHRSVIAGCTALQCNATNGTWMRVTGLQPGTRYLLLQAPASFQQGGSSQQKIYIAMQAYSAGNTLRLALPGTHAADTFLCCVPQATLVLLPAYAYGSWNVWLIIALDSLPKAP